jgi:hypothetical protein
MSQRASVTPTPFSLNDWQQFVTGEHCIPGVVLCLLLSLPSSSMLVNLFEQLLILPAKKDSILLNALRARI